jgi:hypothetical protein
MQHCRRDRHEDHAIHDPLDDDLDRDFDGDVTGDESDLDARHALIGQGLECAEEWYEQRQEGVQANTSKHRPPRL